MPVVIRGTHYVSAETELEFLMEGCKAVADHLYKEFWKDRRKTKLLTRIEVYRDMEEKLRFALDRARKWKELGDANGNSEQ
jgi:hypothetical protein